MHICILLFLNHTFCPLGSPHGLPQCLETHCDLMAMEERHVNHRCRIHPKHRAVVDAISSTQIRSRIARVLLMVIESVLVDNARHIVVFAEMVKDAV